jgi:hypothetical protein
MGRHVVGQLAPEPIELSDFRRLGLPIGRRILRQLARASWQACAVASGSAGLELNCTQV